MTDHEQLKEEARRDVRQTLAASTQFAGMPRADQYDTYRRMVEDRYGELVAARGPRAASVAMAGSRPPPKASDMIDDKRHDSKRIEQAGELAGDFVEAVDFPKFVKDLLKGVFDANIQVMLAQTENYISLMKAASKSVTEFVKAIDDTAAFGYLAENDGGNFSLDFDDEEKDEDGQRKVVLTDKEGQKVDLGDNEIKAKIMDAKIAMAKEQRAMLRETILMGVTRLVVEKGNIKASVLFDFKTTEKIEKRDKAALQQVKSTSSSIKAGGGFLGAIFGGPSGGTTKSTRETRLSVSSAKSNSSTDLSAKLAGSVDITFKTDYFKLDNFAQLYNQPVEQPAQPGGQQPASLPPRPATPTR